MKFILVALLLSMTSLAYAAEPSRFYYPSADPAFELEGFLYEPADLSRARGVVIVIGGSGFTKGGFGGPSKFARVFSDQGYIAFEWNKRGITSNANLTNTTKDFSIYRTATLSNLLMDAERSLELMDTRYPNLPIFVVGGSEGSIVTTHLAEMYATRIRAVSIFGVVVTHFMQVIEKQLSDQVLKKHWKNFDLNEDKYLSPGEFAAITPDNEHWGFLADIGFDAIDVTGDQKISRAEASKATIQFYLIDKEDRDEYWMETSGVAPGYIESIFSVAPLLNRSENISTPVFVLQGEDDWHTPAKYVYQLENVTRLRGQSNFSYTYYAGTAHAPSGEMLSDILRYFGEL